jgi:hypothetical protein
MIEEKLPPCLFETADFAEGQKDQDVQARYIRSLTGFTSTNVNVVTD